MPSVSEKQKRFMDAAAHNPAFAKKVGVPAKVAKEFSKADKGRTFKKGGDTMATKKPFPAALFAKKDTKGAKPGAKGKPFAKGGGIEVKGKTKGKMVTMQKGGKC